MRKVVIHIKMLVLPASVESDLLGPLVVSAVVVDSVVVTSIM